MSPSTDTQPQEDAARLLRRTRKGGDNAGGGAGQKAPPRVESPRSHRVSRGLSGRGGGRWSLVPTPPEFRTTSFQGCGWWPFAAASGAPTTGVPIGPHLSSAVTIRGDHFAWFHEGYISSPSCTVTGLNGYGKSSFSCRMMFGLADRGIASMVAGDLKREYVKPVRAMGGQVVEFGRDHCLNLLDLGAMAAAARRIGGVRGADLFDLAVDRAKDGINAQLQVVRRRPLADYEEAQIELGIRILHARHRDQLPPIVEDLVRLVQTPTQEMIAGLEVSTAQEYAVETTGLRRSLQRLLSGERGRWFNGQTTEPLRIDAPAVCIDISSIYKKADSELASVMLASWAETFGTIEAANALTDAGLEPQRHYNTIMDEMWRPMRLAGANLVEAMDSITRLQRNDGTGNMFITHSPKDFESMDSDADNRKAQGFLERSGMVVTAALTRPDLEALSRVKALSGEEIEQVSSWATPPGWKRRVETLVDPETGKTFRRPAPPPGAGKVLIKVGGRAGLAARVGLTQAEISLHNTNARWLTEVEAKASEPDHDPYTDDEDFDSANFDSEESGR